MRSLFKKRKATPSPSANTMRRQSTQSRSEGASPAITPTQRAHSEDDLSRARTPGDASRILTKQGSTMSEDGDGEGEAAPEQEKEIEDEPPSNLSAQSKSSRRASAFDGSNFSKNSSPARSVDGMHLTVPKADAQSQRKGGPRRSSSLKQIPFSKKEDVWNNLHLIFCEN